MMENFRKNPPKTLGGSDVTFIHDYQFQKTIHLKTGTSEPILLPISNVLQFITDDGSKISVRPSGTEPKIKFYFGVKEKMASKTDFETINQKSNNKLEAIINELKLK